MNMPVKKTENTALKALKQQLKKAVAAEDYEKAIELRDKIRSMEQNG